LVAYHAARAAAELQSANARVEICNAVVLSVLPGVRYQAHDHVTLKVVRDHRIELDSLLTVSPNAAAQNLFKMGFKVGIGVTVDNALVFSARHLLHEFGSAVAPSTCRTIAGRPKSPMKIGGAGGGANCRF
jgi:hypothetical protein